MKHSSKIVPILAICLMACANKENKSPLTIDSVQPNAMKSTDKAGGVATEPASLIGKNLGLDEGEKRDKNENASWSSLEQKQIIQTARLHFQVEELQHNGNKIDSLIKMHDGLITESNSLSSPYTKNSIYTIRVPKNKFQTLINSLCSQASFINQKSISSDDVTEEYVDINARLRNKKEVETRLIEILRNQAKNVEDVLAVENQLRLIREEIEAKEARLNYLKDQVNYCTIQLEYYQTLVVGDVPESNTYNYGIQVKNAFTGGWKILKYFFLAIIYPWPLYILAFIIFKFIRYLLRKRTTNKVNA